MRVELVIPKSLEVTSEFISPDQRLQRVEFLGSSTTRVNVTPVAQHLVLVLLIKIHRKLI